MKNIDILGTDEYINALCDWIEKHQALQTMFPGYVNGPEVDIEEYHFQPSCQDGFDFNNIEWDRMEYEDCAERMNVLTVGVHHIDS